MKKFLTVGLLMLLCGINEVQASFRKKRASKDSGASGFLYESNRAKYTGGSAKNILDALGVEWSKSNGIYMDKDSWAIGMDSYAPWAIVPGLFKVTESVYDKENKEKEMVRKIEDFYRRMGLGAKSFVYQDPKLMSEQLEKDIQALEEEYSKTHYSKKAREQLQEFIYVAQLARNNFNEALLDNFYDAQLDLYLKKLDTEPVVEVLAVAGVDLAKSKKDNDQVGQIVYPELISWLKSIEKEVKKFEDQENDFDEAIKLAEKDKRKAGSDVEQAQIYDAVIAQLKINKAAINKEGGAQAKEFKSILKNFKFTDDPRKDLEQAKADLNDLEMDKISRMNYGYKENSKEVLDYDKKIKAQLKLIDDIKIRIKKFDSDVDHKVAEIVKSHDGDKNKALESLLPEISKTTYAYSFLDNASVQKKRIESITSDADDKNLSSKEKLIKQQAAKKLQEQIAKDKVQAAQEDPLIAARLRLSKASVAEMPGATQAVVFALLAKGGISIETLPYDAKESLQVILSIASDKLVAIAQSTKMSESQKLQQKQIVTRKLIEDVGTLCSPYYTGFSVGGLKAAAKGDAVGAGLDYLTNKLMNSAAAA